MRAQRNARRKRETQRRRSWFAATPQRVIRRRYGLSARLNGTAQEYTLACMHSLSNERRQARKHRRRQVRRRRIVAFAVGVLLLLLAIWAAYALPQTRAARVPVPAVVSPFADAKGVEKRIIVARVGDIDILLPVKLDATTAIAFHPVDNANGVAFEPVGVRADAEGVTTKLADIFSSGGGMQYYLMEGNGGDGSAETAGLDVGAVPGEFVYSPANGKVVAVKEYQLLGKYPDTEIQIQLADDPSLLLVVTHVAKTSVGIGDQVEAGHTALGRVRRFPVAVEQGLKQFTNDSGDHVQMIALRMDPQLSGF